MREKEIKKFFDFIFDDDVYCKYDADNNIYNIDFTKSVAKISCLFNMARIKKVLNLYFVHNNLGMPKFKINIIENNENR